MNLIQINLFNNHVNHPNYNFDQLNPYLTHFKFVFKYINQLSY